jgi:hypothetical protein
MCDCCDTRNGSYRYDYSSVLCAACYLEPFDGPDGDTVYPSCPTCTR